ncbi:MAG: hypothetical protein ACREIB_05490 [Pseudomonadota bacterium]
MSDADPFASLGKNLTGLTKEQAEAQLPVGDPGRTRGQTGLPIMAFWFSDNPLRTKDLFFARTYFEKALARQALEVIIAGGVGNREQRRHGQRRGFGIVLNTVTGEAEPVTSRQHPNPEKCLDMFQEFCDRKSRDPRPITERGPASDIERLPWVDFSNGGFQPLTDAVHAEKESGR